MQPQAWPRAGGGATFGKNRRRKCPVGPGSHSRSSHAASSTAMSSCPTNAAVNGALRFTCASQNVIMEARRASVISSRGTSRAQAPATASSASGEGGKARDASQQIPRTVVLSSSRMNAFSPGAMAMRCCRLRPFNAVVVATESRAMTVTGNAAEPFGGCTLQQFTRTTQDHCPDSGHLASPYAAR
jgi:hypothetical protein